MNRSIIQAAQKIDFIPEDCILSFSSSDFVCDSMTTQYIRSDKSSSITMQEIDSIIKKIEKESFDRARAKAREQYGIDHDDVKLVSSTITRISIDGKNIANPIGFSGGKIRLTVFNVFVPASEFNILRSVIASTGKQPISLIPTPLIFPKVLEQTSYHGHHTCVIDIGSAHTTILTTEDSEISTFETFPIGTSTLIDMIASADTDLSPIQIENILCEYT